MEPEVLTVYPGVCPLTVAKSIDPAGPTEQGNEVTVTIRYANTGNRPASDVVLNDSLSGRLEYVPGSAAVGPGGELRHGGERGRVGRRALGVSGDAHAGAGRRGAVQSAGSVVGTIPPLTTLLRGVG